MTKPVVMELVPQTSTEDVWERWRDQLEDALEKHAHGTYTIEDIEGFVQNGDMVIWPTSKSMALVETFDYPQVKCLHVFMALGELQDIYDQMAHIEDFARFMGCDMVSTNGRVGWARQLKKRGWKQQGWFTKTLDEMEIN